MTDPLGSKKDRGVEAGNFSTRVRPPLEHALEGRTCADAHGRERTDAGNHDLHARTLEKTTELLLPPNAYALLSATSTRMFLAVLGTTSRAHSGSGVS